MASQDEIVSEISAAIERDDAEALRHVISTHGLTGDPNLGPWLALAAQCGKLAALDVLLDLGASVHWRSEDGETAFSYACACDQFDAARVLHEHGADINSVDSGGGTPLDWAVCHARPEFRDWLKAVGGTRKMTHEEWPWPPPGN